MEIRIILPEKGSYSLVVIFTVLLFIEIPDDNTDQLLFLLSLKVVGFGVDFVESFRGIGYSLLGRIGLDVQS